MSRKSISNLSPTPNKSSPSTQSFSHLGKESGHHYQISREKVSIVPGKILPLIEEGNAGKDGEYEPKSTSPDTLNLDHTHLSETEKDSEIKTLSKFLNTYNLKEISYLDESCYIFDNQADWEVAVKDFNQKASSPHEQVEVMIGSSNCLERLWNDLQNGIEKTVIVSGDGAHKAPVSLKYDKKTKGLSCVIFESMTRKLSLTIRRAIYENLYIKAAEEGINIDLKPERYLCNLYSLQSFKARCFK